jgi:hypothetical protein
MPSTIVKCDTNDIKDALIYWAANNMPEQSIIERNRVSININDSPSSYSITDHSNRVTAVIG